MSSASASEVWDPRLGEDMVWIHGGTFRMGSNDHYPAEAPAHDVHVDGFHCRPCRPAARHVQPVDTSTSHVGFRCVRRSAARRP